MTRVRGHHKPSLLDLVITENSQTLFDDVAHEDPLGKRDHCVLRWKYLVSVANPDDEGLSNQTPSPLHLDVNKGDYKDLNLLLSEVDWETHFDTGDLTDCVDTFYKQVKAKIDQCVPYKKRKNLKNQDRPG